MPPAALFVPHLIFMICFGVRMCRFFSSSSYIRFPPLYIYMAVVGDGVSDGPVEFFLGAQERILVMCENCSKIVCPRRAQFDDLCDFVSCVLRTYRYILIPFLRVRYWGQMDYVYF